MQGALEESAVRQLRHPVLRDLSHLLVDLDDALDAGVLALPAALGVLAGRVMSP